jgi:hypothetical protein
LLFLDVEAVFCRPVLTNIHLMHFIPRREILRPKIILVSISVIWLQVRPENVLARPLLFRSPASNAEASIYVCALFPLHMRGSLMPVEVVVRSEVAAAIFHLTALYKAILGFVVSVGF